MRRAAKQAAAVASTEPDPLPAELDTYLQTFAPQKTPACDVPVVRPAVVEVMRRATHLTGMATFKKYVVDVTALATWAHGAQRDLTWTSLMDHAVIADFARAQHSGCSPTTIAHRCDRLQNLASRLNPGPNALPHITVTAHAAVKPPYTDAEMRHIERIAATQPSPVIGRKLTAIIALSRGAGATAADLRGVRVSDITDNGDAGIDVTLRGSDTARTVPVRRAYEDHLRRGIAGLGTNSLIVATRGGPNTANLILAKVVDLSVDAPRIEAARLRTTWIADLICSPVPLHVLLAAAGLKSARSVSEIQTHLAAHPESYAKAAAVLTEVVR